MTCDLSGFHAVGWFWGATPPLPDGKPCDAWLGFDRRVCPSVDWTARSGISLRFAVRDVLRLCLVYSEMDDGRVEFDCEGGRIASL